MIKINWKYKNQPELTFVLPDWMAQIPSNILWNLKIGFSVDEINSGKTEFVYMGGDSYES